MILTVSIIDISLIAVITILSVLIIIYLIKNNGKCSGCMHNCDKCKKRKK